MSTHTTSFVKAICFSYEATTGSLEREGSQLYLQSLLDLPNFCSDPGWIVNILSIACGNYYDINIYRWLPYRYSQHKKVSRAELEKEFENVSSSPKKKKKINKL